MPPITNPPSPRQELDALITEHEKWAKAGCDPDKPGRADLGGRIFSDVPFRSAFAGKDLRDAIFTGANLSGVDLTETDLRGAELDGANLTSCDLCDTRFEGANLKKADLTGAVNLTSRRFGRADVERIQFPAGFALDGVGQVDEWLKGANSLYLLYLSLCLFSVIVAYSTSDVQIITETGQAKLPLIDIQLPILWFFVLAPVLISIIYLVFRINLLRACEGMAELPAIYEDGQTIHKKVHPVIINSVFLYRLRRLEGKHPAFHKTQTLITTFTVFFVPHLALLAIWGKFLVRQLWWVSVIHIGIYVLAAIIGYGMKNEAWAYRKETPARKRMFPFRYLRATTFSVVAFTGLLLSLFTGLLLFLTFGSLGYLPYDKGRQNESVAKRILAWVGLHSEARVSGEDISTGKPLNWRDAIAENSNEEATLPMNWHMVLSATERGAKNTKKPLTLIVRPGKSTTESVDSQWQALVAPVQGAKLSQKQLRGMSASGAFLVKAKLVNSDLQCADLSSAHLQFADLRGANLHRADLRGAFLYKALLYPYPSRDEKGTNVDLSNAHLEEANLTRCDLAHANLYHSHLTIAKLTGAQLPNANLAQADLIGADLRGADLGGANLTLANLTLANLSDANLSGADLRGADLRGAGLGLALGIENANLAGARYYRDAQNFYNTDWPNGFDPVKAGAIEVDGDGNEVRQKAKR